MALPNDAYLDEQRRESTPDGRLTSIHTPYTLAATPKASEVDELMIRHFIETIAEVALAVASRKMGERKS
jgi:hypothetical protein